MLGLYLSLVIQQIKEYKQNILQNIETRTFVGCNCFFQFGTLLNFSATLMQNNLQIIKTGT